MTKPTYDELLQENRELRVCVAALEAENAQPHRELEALCEELAHLQGQDDDLLPFVKPRRQAEEPKPPGAASRAVRALHDEPSHSKWTKSGS